MTHRPFVFIVAFLFRFAYLFLKKHKKPKNEYETPQKPKNVENFVEVK